MRRIHRDARRASGCSRRGEQVVGLDNLNPYYDVRLKEARLRELCRVRAVPASEARPRRSGGARAAVPDARPARVVHLAAQAGVRYSLQDPHAYVSSNLVGFVNLLEACRHGGVEHLVYASTSSVYGANVSTPFREDDPVDHPVSLYAATKRSNELMAHTYSHLFGLPTTGLRFFTVYGPWGRPGHVDGALHQGHPRGRADQGLQPRQDAARLHLRRRHRRGCRARARADPAGGTADSPDAYARPVDEARLRSGSTTSATASRSSCSSTSA